MPQADIGGDIARSNVAYKGANRAPPVSRREQTRLRDTASGDPIHADGASTLQRARTVCPGDRADIDPLRQLLFDREDRISASRAMIEKLTGPLSQRLWCGASVARRAVRRILSG